MEGAPRTAVPPWTPAVLVTGLVAVSTAAVLIRLTEAPSLTIAFWRITIAGALLLPVWLSHQRRAQLRGLDTAQRWRLAGAGFFLGIHFAAWIASLAYTSVAVSVLLVTTNPVWVGLLSPWVVGERPSRRAWVGIIIATAGAGVVAMDGSGGAYPDAMLGNGLALLGALSASAYFMMGRRVRPEMDIWGYTSSTLLGAWVVLAIAVLIGGSPLLGFPLSSWGWLVAMALGPQLIGHGSLSWALRYVRADVVAVTLLAEPIGAALLAWWVLAEVPGEYALLGAPLLLVGIGVVARENTG
ncbi:MAG: DMT family transporter [Myxococcota bacterium]|nr:DMT family transporter [Myxococcota bacterium]